MSPLQPICCKETGGAGIEVIRLVFKAAIAAANLIVTHIDSMCLRKLTSYFTGSLCNLLQIVLSEHLTLWHQQDWEPPRPILCGSFSSLGGIPRPCSKYRGPLRV